MQTNPITLTLFSTAAQEKEINLTEKTIDDRCVQDNSHLCSAVLVCAEEQRRFSFPLLNSFST